MKKILVAGATGYLGGHIIRELKRQHYFVRALARNTTKLKQLRDDIDEAVEAEVTKPETLDGCCQEIDTVISSIGITRQKDGLTYMDIDYQANLNLLKEAQRSGVRKFIYIFIFNAEKISKLKIIAAKQKFAEALRQSGMDYCLVKPTGFFSDMDEFLAMAQKGSAYLFGTGNFKMNPIDGTDLAKACVAAIENDEKEFDIGGPEILTHQQIAEAAFKVLHKPARIRHISLIIKNIVLFLLHTFTRVQTYGPVEFLMAVLTIDMVAPPYGSHKLEDHFREKAAGMETGKALHKHQR